MEEAFNFINQIIKLDLGVSEGMKELLKYCNNQHESNIWEDISKLNFYEDTFNLKEWLEYNLSNENLEDVGTLYFGLFDAVDEEGQESCMLYVSGIEGNYDEEALLDGDYEECFFLEDSYAESTMLYEMSKILKSQEEVQELGEYVLYLGYASLCIKDIIRKIDKQILLEYKNSMDIIVGFDSGDYIVLQSIYR